MATHVNKHPTDVNCAMIRMMKFYQYLCSITATTMIRTINRNPLMPPTIPYSVIPNLEDSLVCVILSAIEHQTIPYCVTCACHGIVRIHCFKGWKKDGVTEGHDVNTRRTHSFSRETRWVAASACSEVGPDIF